MNRNLRSAFAAAFAVLFTNLSAMAWSNAVMISSIDDDSTAGGNGTSAFVTPATAPSGKPSACTSSNLELAGSADHVRTMTALATAAFLAGKPVKFTFDTSCDGVYAKVTGLMIQ